MNTSKAKKATKDEEVKKDCIVVASHEVSRVRVVPVKGKDDLVFFSLTLNGVSINNCRVVSGKNGDFISWPQYKGSNNQYYNVVFAKLHDEDVKMICDEIQAIIDKGEND